MAAEVVAEAVRALAAVPAALLPVEVAFRALLAEVPRARSSTSQAINALSEHLTKPEHLGPIVRALRQAPLAGRSSKSSSSMLVPGNNLRSGAVAIKPQGALKMRINASKTAPNLFLPSGTLTIRKLGGIPIPMPMRL